jgi:ubiquinone/menaquinone biosynthesis C-methylase UbiE
LTRLDDPDLVAREYADEARLRRRAETYTGERSGIDAREPAVRALVEAAPRCVLEVGCGWGALAEWVAEATGAEVVATDLSPRMVDLARERGVDARLADVQALPFGDGEFDVVLCQLGLQFFPDRPAAVREMRRVLVGSGHLGASVFTSIERNPAARALADAIDRHLGGDASRAKRSEHSLSDPQELRELFEASGFDNVRLETVTQAIRFHSVEEWVEIQFTATPLADPSAVTEKAERERMVGRVAEDVARALSRFSSADAFVFPQEVYVVHADS